MLLQDGKLQRHQGRKRLKACGLSEKPVTLQQIGREPDSWNNHSAREDSRGSNVEDMRNRLRAHGAPVWSTNAQMWPQFVHAEIRRELQKRDEAWLADRARELASAGVQGELRVSEAPEEQSSEERARHEITHLPYQPWCAWCVMERGRAKLHLQRPVESVKVPEFEMHFCYLLQDPMKRHEPGDQARTATLARVDVAAQNPRSIVNEV